ncbi:hypothetical protein HQ544_02195 [Candidatus Falkowbacteria bacterium]|nr:hypothetical protein [Candidatus Falkowbacteria bacterium]
MYFFLYDSFLSDKRYEKALARIEARVADLGIKGRVVKLTILQQLEETIKEAIDRGAKTVVAVGNDKTISGAIAILAGYKHVTLGIIPVGEENEIAKILGIPEEELACDVISNRLIDILDVGRINEQYFFKEVRVEDEGLVLECDGRYKIKPKEVEEIVIYNFGYNDDKKINPKDGALELMIKPKIKKNEGLFSMFKKKQRELDSVFINRFIRITSLLKDEKGSGIKEKFINIDGIRKMKTPATITVAGKRLKVIVGKERLF